VHPVFMTAQIAAVGRSAHILVCILDGILNYIILQKSFSASFFEAYNCCI
jgi:hypothetical protein